MDLICTNGKFSAEVLDFYNKHGVSTPVVDKMYTLREIIKTTNGKTGVRLEEIKNPKVPIVHKILNQNVMVEPSFDINRFCKLNGELLSSDEVRELIKETVNA